MEKSRRTFLQGLGAGVAGLSVSTALGADVGASPNKPHLITLSFDDGFKKSFTRVAEIYEKHALSACLNVLADGIPDDEYIKKWPLGDFALWNELKRRGHEIMPHGYRHENLQKLPLQEAQESIGRCLGVFTEKLQGFDSKQAVFNFPYTASTPELERWLVGRVRAFRTWGEAINPMPHHGQVKLTCINFGPDNAEAAIDHEIENLLARKSGWLIFNTHGLDDEGWGPIRSSYLDGLLKRLLAIETVEILPVGSALATYAS